MVKQTLYITKTKFMPYNTNVPTALVFFARPDVLKSTFEAIRKAKPKTLFLIQDGARLNRQDDLLKIDECRKIVENIDWECRVFRNYSEDNLGCGMRVFSGLSWAFQYVDRLAIIEDDCVPSLDFFQFCEEILEKYKDDERIDMISGMNNLGIYDKTPYDYFFSDTGSIWGWATWKRVWNTIDFNLGHVNDLDAERLITNLYGPSLFKNSREKFNQLKLGQRLSSWSLQRGMNMYLNSRLIIIPKYNLITNIGLTENGANSANSIKLVPRGLRRIYYMQIHEMNFPLKHPKFVINDIEFRNKLDRLMANGYPLVKLYRTFESGFYRLIYGDFKGLLKALKRRLK